MAVVQVSNLNDVLTVLGTPKGTTISLVQGSLQQLAISDQPLANFPGKDFKPYLVLSSGIANTVGDPNTSGSQGTDLGAGGTIDDAVSLLLTIPIPPGTKVIGFDFTFLSEEYPEFVGTNFNDFFSVKLNGVEIAKDTNNNPITVNNDFFSDFLTPTGTFFDGQTPPLRAFSAIPAGATSITLQLTLADVGDGIYDSAAFLNHFTLSPPQIVYLEFGAASVDLHGILGPAFEKAAFAMSNSDKASLEAKLDLIYQAFLVDFTLAKPDSGSEYTTVYVGDVANIPWWYSFLGVTTNTLGLASDIDGGNANKEDDAIVFSNHFSGGATVDKLAQVVAHEAGHLFGLSHVLDTQLMFPFAGPAFTVIGGPSDLAKIQNGQVVSLGKGKQNSFNELANALGLANSSKVLEQSTYLDAFKKFFNLDFSTLSTTYYNAKLMVFDEAESFVQDIGHIAPNSIKKIELPVAVGDKFILLAQSVEGGAYDVVSLGSGTGGSVGTLAGKSVDDLALALSSNSGTLAFDLDKLSSTGAATKVDVASASFDTAPIYVKPLTVTDLLSMPTSATLGELVDFDGNHLGGVGSWKILGQADVQGDGDNEYVMVNREIGRWATVGPDKTGMIDLVNNSWNGDTRVVGIYIDPLVASGEVVKGSPHDSQQRFQNDLKIENIATILGTGDYDDDSLQEMYFGLTDHTAFLHAYMHADGNIHYANYQNQQQMQEYMLSHGYGPEVWALWA